MKKQINDLIDRAKNDLIDADLLLNNARFNTSVNRSYYAMFHTAQALLLTKEIINHTHKGVIMQYSKHFVQTGIFDKNTGRTFAKMQDERERSDYEIGFKASQNDAQEAYEQAKEFYKIICDYLVKNQYID